MKARKGKEREREFDQRIAKGAFLHPAGFNRQNKWEKEENNHRHTHKHRKEEGNRVSLLPPIAYMYIYIPSCLLLPRYSVSPHSISVRLLPLLRLQPTIVVTSIFWLRKKP
jgi:hypothetical protein